MASNNQFNLVSTPVSSTSRFVGTPVSSSLSEQGKKSRGSQCCVPKCFNYMYNKDGSRSSQHFFRFPTEKDRKLKFCTLIKRVDGKDGFNVTDATRICSDHFNSSDFTGGMMKKKLKPEAEPSKFSWSVEREGRPAPRQRLFTEPKVRSASKSSTSKASTCSIEVQTDISYVDEIKILLPFSTDHQYAMPSFNEHPFSLVEANDALKQKISALELRNSELQTRLHEMSFYVKKLEERLFSVENTLVGDDDAVRFYTGFSNYGAFYAVSVFKYMELAMESAHY